MCIDAPESTTNSRSSGLSVDAGRHLFSEGEKNVALSCSFNFNTFLASFHAASRAPCSCEGDGDVVGVVTSLVRGIVQVLHGDKVVELRV